MAENKTMDKIHRDILKKFHTLCSVLGLTDAEKRAIVESYGVESSRDMDTHGEFTEIEPLQSNAYWS